MVELSRKDSIHCFQEHISHVDTVPAIEFTDSRRAGYIDFGQVLTDNVQADENKTFFAERGCYLLHYPAVALGQRRSWG